MYKMISQVLFFHILFSNFTYNNQNYCGNTYALELALIAELFFLKKIFLIALNSCFIPRKTYHGASVSFLKKKKKFQILKSNYDPPSASL